MTTDPQMTPRLALFGVAGWGFVLAAALYVRHLIR